MAAPTSGFAPIADLQPLIDTCVHCGFCLPSCPSYVLLGQEMDSPRGRIYLMKAGLEDRLTVSPSVVAHFDTCLGCMACETACPSGVRYGPLVEGMRVAIERHSERPWGDRFFRSLLFRILPYPNRLRVLALPLALLGKLRRFSRTLFPKLDNMLALAPKVTLRTLKSEVPERTDAQGERRLTVGLLTGCVQRAFFGHVNQATARALAAEGCEVHAPRHQGCCGALALHAGRDDEARSCAKGLIQTFEASGVDQVVVNAAGCGSTMKSYGHLLRKDPEWADRARIFASRVRDVSETLAALEPRAPRHPLHLRLAYHDACHLAHAQGIRRAPRQLLESIPGVTLVPLAETEICCGSAGIFNLVAPDMAADLGRRKARWIDDANPDVIVTSNPGCLLQISAAAHKAGHQRPVVHLVEMLDASIRGTNSFAGRIDPIHPDRDR